MPQIELPSLEAVVRLNRCEAPPPVPVVTTVASVREDQSLYVSTGVCLYAVNAADGAVRWCQQVTLLRTREVKPHPMMSSPPPPRMHFATPRVVGGVVYVCMYGFVSYTSAFTADDGSLRWWTPTDAQVAGMPFMDFAVPLVRGGIVYSGTYALNAQDGAVLWRLAVDTRVGGTLALHALVDETLYATTQWGIYAINAQDGQVRWRYSPDTYSHVSGPPIVAGGLLYAGTNAFVGYPLKGYLFALDVATGTEIWRYPMGDYIGAVVHNETIYISSGDRFLYALDKKSGRLRWHHQFAASGYHPATIADDVLYVIADGLHALSSEDGAVLWHQPLGSSPSITFIFEPPVVLDGAVYLVRMDKRARGMHFALDTRTGAECWHTPYPSAVQPLAIAQ